MSTESPVVRAVRLLGRNALLAAPAEKLTQASAAVASSPAGDVLQGKPFGTSLHAALVHVPLGGVVAALVVDLVGGEELEKATMLLTRLTFLSAVPAALAGLADYSRITGEESRRIGASHALGAAKGSALAFASCLSRVAGARGAARVLLVAAGASYAVAGHLGGFLAYGSREA